MKRTCGEVKKTRLLEIRLYYILKPDRLRKKIIQAMMRRKAFHSK